jgi:hypothetical protein
VRMFLMREGSSVSAFLGVSTTASDGPIYWCGKNDRFESAAGDSLWGRDGVAILGAPRNLDGISVQVSSAVATVFPHTIVRGGDAPAPDPGLRLKAPCAASERVG